MGVVKQFSLTLANFLPQFIAVNHTLIYNTILIARSCQWSGVFCVN